MNYNKNGIKTNAYSVSLSDPTGVQYGIKNYNTNDILVPAGTSTQNPYVGVYQFETNFNDTQTYVVSWQVIQNFGDLPVYVERKQGPFIPAELKTSANANIKGQMAPGTDATLSLSVTDFSGSSIDADEIDISIYDGNGTAVVSAGTPQRLAKGMYSFIWTIPSAQQPGVYTVSWRYREAGVDRYQQDKFQVTASPTGSKSTYSPMLKYMMTALDYYISCAQHIPVYFQQARPSKDRKTFQFSFNKWNQSNGVIVYRNKHQIISEGYSIDYENGLVIFDQKQTAYDMVYVDYNFRWFTQQELAQYVRDAVAYVNAYPPNLNYSVDNIPQQWAGIAILQAAVNAIRKLMFCLQFQQPAQVFGGTDKANQAFGNLNTLKQNYQDQINKALEQKKYGPLPMISSTSTSQIALPSSRSRFFRSLFTANNSF